jgi:hypothetical protein
MWTKRTLYGTTETQPTLKALSEGPGDLDTNYCGRLPSAALMTLEDDLSELGLAQSEDSFPATGVCVYYCRTYDKAVCGGGGGQ